MQIETIRLRDFRNYHSLILTPHPGVNILLGQNGSGKTNLLEAVHYCALGRSHRTGLDREVVRKGAMMAASGVTLRKKSGKTEIAVKLTPSEARKKTVFIDCKRAERISALMGHVQCVIFSPEDLMLVKEGPAIRRRMLDMMLSQLSTAYFSALQQYQKALEQRTALLREAKRGITPDPVLLDTFEEAMATPCGIIMPLRDKLVKQLAKIAADQRTAERNVQNDLSAVRAGNEQSRVGDSGGAEKKQAGGHSRRRCGLRYSPRGHRAVADGAKHEGVRVAGANPHGSVGN